MKLHSLRIENFRSIKFDTIYFDKLTSLVGANGAGKSSFLRALQVFFGQEIINERDFYNNVIAEIVIGVTFCDLTQRENEQFEGYTEDGLLSVEFVHNGSKASYHGTALQNPEFDAVREGFQKSDRGASAKAAWATLIVNVPYDEFGAYGSALKAEETLKGWEVANREACIRRRDDGQFFGFKGVGLGYLREAARFIYIPAVSDASTEAIEKKGNALAQLMQLIVHGVLKKREDIKVNQERIQQEYRALVDPSNLPELATLGAQLDVSLKSLVSDAGVALKWVPAGDLNLSFPTAEVELIEDGYQAPVTLVGHGLQRAFIISILQLLAGVTTPGETGTDEEGVSLILAIEEPELYQHPGRQRHLYDVLQQLASGAIHGVISHTQVLFGTHSPYLLSFEHFDDVRLVRKIVVQPGEPKCTINVRATLDSLVDALKVLDNNQKYTRESVLSRLHILQDSKIVDGFFARSVVLTEGPDDRSALLGVALAMGHDLFSMGIHVADCGGKNNLDRPYLVFKSLGIPTFIIWDSDKQKGESEGTCPECLRPRDKKARPEDNHRLMRMLAMKEEDWPSFVAPNAACFEGNLEEILRHDIGNEYEKIIQAKANEFGYASTSNARKNPYVVSAVVAEALNQGIRPSTLEEIIKKIVAMNNDVFKDDFHAVIQGVEAVVLEG
ncbi:MAG: ATP-dependent endonuclease [Bacteroidota bacterium]|nr:ATP-dependent endonuclease [Bacteroidota bacterium]MDP4234551.1 ATP-dependent endonuclease [Bacteroidota bacterium]MDP4242616.1 ATP-dependent endonuclease [Bacteroidota bacterium]